MLLLLLIAACEAPCPEGYEDQAGLCWIEDDAKTGDEGSSPEPPEAGVELPTGAFRILPAWLWDLEGYDYQLYESVEAELDGEELEAVWSHLIVDGEDVVCEIRLDVTGEVDEDEEDVFESLDADVIAIASEASVDQDDCGVGLPATSSVSWGFVAIDDAMDPLAELGMDEEELREFVGILEDEGYTSLDLVVWRAWDQQEGVLPAGFVVVE